MNKFYTFCEQIGNRIFHKYIDEDGQSHIEVKKGFPISLYVKSKSSNVAKTSTGLMNEKLGEIEFDDIAEAKKFIESYKNVQEIYGQTNLLYQFISKTYPGEINFDFKKICILAIDIETSYDATGFPTPEKANQEILSIACKIIGSKNPFVVFGTKSSTKEDHFTFIQCENEEKMLISFQKYWREINPDIITGWNIESFDIPYIINRSNKIMDENFTKKFSPFYGNLDRCVYNKEYTNKLGHKINTFIIVGVTMIDYLELYKKYSSSTLESYRLEVVAQHELKMGKVDYSEYGDLMGVYLNNYDLFLNYNMTDVKIIEDLENKLNFLFLAATIAYLGKTKFSDVFTTVRWWDTMIYNSLLSKNIQIPPEKKNKRESIVGAYVKEAIPSRYSWIVTLDLTSLYPSIMMSFNLSPETLHSSACFSIEDINDFIEMKKDLSWIKKSNVAMLANGATFKRDGQGILPELVAGMFSSRKAFKKHANQVAKEIEEIKEELQKRELL